MSKQDDERMIRALDNFYASAYGLLLAWENVDNQERVGVDKYPFGNDFAEKVHEIADWVEHTKSLLKKKFVFEDYMTVGDLLNALEDLDPETHVAIYDEPSGWWKNIKSIQHPDDDEGLVTLAIYPGDDFDVHQI